MRDKMLPFRAKSVRRELAEAAHIRTAEKSGGGLKTFGSVLIHRVVFDSSRRVLQKIVKCGSSFVRAVEKIRRARQRLELQVPGSRKRQLGIYAAHAIGFDDARIVGASGTRCRIQFAVGVNKPNRRLLADVAIHANDIEVGTMVMKRVGRGNAASGRLIVGKERPNRPRTPLPS